MKYDNLNIYEATYDEVYEAVREQYKEKVHTDYNYKTLTVKDWYEINRNIKQDLKEMDIKFQNAFYNPNNMRVYIKQKFWTENLHLFEGLSKEQQKEEIAIYGSRKEARDAWNKERTNTSMIYSIRTNTDYYTEDEEYFTVPAW